MSQLLRALVLVLLGAGAAGAQTVTDVMVMPDVAEVHRLVAARDGSIHLLATQRGKTDPVLISAARPKRRVALPGVDAKTVQTIALADRGVVVTWVADGVVHQVSSATGRALPPRPVPAALMEDTLMLSVTPGSGGGLLLVADRYGDGESRRVVVLDRQGREVPIDKALLARASYIAFARDNAYLWVKVGESEAWFYSVATGQRVPEGAAKGLRVESPDTFPPYDDESGQAWVTRGRAKGELQVRDYRTQDHVYWSLVPFEGPFVVAKDAIFIARPVKGRWRVQRIAFKGGLKAWVEGELVAMREAERRKEGREWVAKELAAQEAARAAELARQEQEYVERARLAKQAADEREAEERRAWARAAASGPTPEPSSGGKAERESIEDAARRLVEDARSKGMTLELSRFGTSNATTPLTLTGHVRGKFTVLLLVDARAVKTELRVRVREPSSAIASSYDQAEERGWLLNGTNFHTEGESVDLVIEGAGHTYGNVYPTALLLFSR
ncbi:MAG: hypothetical protein EP329_25640 [Deltaproteobacteria bacterium]|nr:MAG: hypothetical protein EP329_25640 [Deltaproteobacteria bacterium]